MLQWDNLRGFLSSFPDGPQQDQAPGVAPAAVACLWTRARGISVSLPCFLPSHLSERPFPKHLLHPGFYLRVRFWGDPS